MKKRFISMLLAVLLVVSLFGGTSVSAYADSDYNTFKYTIVSGDTLLQICNNSGLNFYTCQTAINKLNNFTSEAQYRKLYVGQVITLPASNEDAAKIASSYVSGGSTSGGTSTGGSTSSGNVSGNVAYWLIPYTIQSGETITGVCNTLGISFSSYADQIMKINNISSWNRIPAGKTLLLPSAVKPAAGISCYAVIAHKVTQGETTYGICQNYGISYTSNASLLQALNPKVNFNFIKYNTTMLVPVSTVITAGDSGSSSGGSTGGSTSGGSTGGSTSGGSTGGSTSTKTYAIKSSSSGGGSVSFAVSGKSVTAASAGSTVTIKTSPDANKTLDAIKVVTSDKSAVISVNNGTFTMPESDVQVTATFGSGYLVGPSVKGDGTLSCTVNNVPVTHAVKGATVKVTATPGAGSSLASITVVNFSNEVLFSGLKSGDTFTMPGEKVLVRVVFNSAATYGFTKEATTNGSFSLQVLGSEVTRAAAGSTVKVVTNPNSGYDVDKIVVIDDSSKQQINYNNSDTFTMPYSNVTVSVSYVLRGDDTYKVDIETVNGGTISTNGVTKSAGGKTIKLSSTAYPGCVLDYYTITYGGGITEKVSGSSFKMPYSDVTVSGYFKKVEGQLSMNNTSPAWGTLTVTDSTGKVLGEGDALAAGSQVTVTVNVTDPGYGANISTTRGETITSGSQVTVPTDGNLGIIVTYDYKSYTLTVENEWVDSFYLDVYVNGNHYEKIELSSKGQKVSVPAYATVQAKPLNGSSITGMTLDGNLANGDSIKMPAANAKLKVQITEAGATSLSLAPLTENAEALAPLA